MKNIFSSILISSLFFFSCSKEDSIVLIYEPGPMTYGWAKAKKNGVDFSASCFAIEYDQPYSDYFAVRFTTETVEGFDREQITLVDLGYSAKSYSLGPYDDRYNGVIGASYGIFTADGDVIQDFYIWDESATNNYLTITDVDTIGNIIKGNFTVTFIIEPDREKVNPDNPDKVTFSDAEFEVSFR